MNLNGEPNVLESSYLFRKMLTDAFRIIVNNSFKESFYEKRKKINVLIIFSIFYKSGVILGKILSIDESPPLKFATKTFILFTH